MEPKLPVTDTSEDAPLQFKTHLVVNQKQQRISPFRNNHLKGDSFVENTNDNVFFNINMKQTDQ